MEVKLKIRTGIILFLQEYNALRSLRLFRYINRSFIPSPTLNRVHQKFCRRGIFLREKLSFRLMACD